MKQSQNPKYQAWYAANRARLVAKATERKRIERQAFKMPQPNPFAALEAAVRGWYA